jgi:hypothetical protein
MNICGVAYSTLVALMVTACAGGGSSSGEQNQGVDTDADSGGPTGSIEGDVGSRCSNDEDCTPIAPVVRDGPHVHAVLFRGDGCSVPRSRLKLPRWLVPVVDRARHPASGDDHIGVAGEQCVDDVGEASSPPPLFASRTATVEGRARRFSRN